MRYVFFFVPLLAACNTPSPGFVGVQATKHHVLGSTFQVRVKDDLAEVIRTSPEPLPKFDVVARKAAFAAHEASGCKAAWVEGDVALMVMGLSCDGRPAPEKPAKRRSLWCEIVTDGAFVCEELG